MGAINYFTSDYITMGLRPYDRTDFENDLDFMEADFANIETELNKHSFQYYHITIKPGYYEGFTLDIENNFPVAFDSWEDRKEANKEITEIKGFLIDCAGFGLVQCSPGWCTGYNDYKGTIVAIKAAIKEMREEVKRTPTWAQYERAV